MLPFHGGDPGSNPGRGVKNIFVNSRIKKENIFRRGWPINLHKKGKVSKGKTWFSFGSKGGRGVYII